MVAVFSAADLQDDWKAAMPCAWPVTEDMKNPAHYPLTDVARHQGDGVAVVIAESRALARDAAELVEVDWEPLDAIADVAKALDDGAHVVHPDIGTNECYVWQLDTDATGEKLEEADVVVTRSYYQPRLIPNAIEPRGVLAVPGLTEDVTLYSATQIPHILRLLVAATLGMAESKLRVVAPDVGGGFGSKLDVYAEELLAVALARRLGRPVKWLEDRTENYLATIHGRDVVTEYTLAAKKDGTITHCRARVKAAMGAYLQLVTPGIPLLGAWIYAGPYAIPNYSVELVGVFTNTTPTDAYRGAGRPEATYVIERTMDALADELGMDRIELRRKNFITEFPATLASGLTIDSGDYHASLDRLLELLDLDALPGRPGQTARQRDGEAARRRVLDLQRDVRPRAVANPRRDPLRRGRLGAGHDPLPADRLGAGRHRDVAARAGARDCMGADRRRRARLRHRRGRGPPRRHLDRPSRSRHLRQPQPSGRRCRALLRRPRSWSRRRDRSSRIEQEVSPDDLEFAEGTFTVKGSPDKETTLASVAWAAWVAHDLPEGMEPGLEATAAYDPPNFSWPGGAHAAVVEVDTETGDARLIRYVAVDDVGTVINPTIVDGQVHGGITQGISTALYEEGVYDEDGNLLTVQSPHLSRPVRCRAAVVRARADGKQEPDEPTRCERRGGDGHDRRGARP